MKRLPLHRYLLSLLLPLSALADTPISQNVPIDPASTARLIIERDRNAPNACDLQLSIDNQLIASLPVGESLTLDIPSGERVVVLTPSRDGFCGDIQLISSQSLLMLPGETRRYQAVYEEQKLFLAPQQ